MRLNQDGITPENKQMAINVRNHLIAGNRVIGDPGEGLRQTLATLENARDNRIFGKSDWKMKDPEIDSQISKTKAGIKGEEDLCEYLARLIKYDDNLNGLVAFASLAYQFENKNVESFVNSLENITITSIDRVNDNQIVITYSNSMRVYIKEQDYIENENYIKTSSPGDVIRQFALTVDEPQKDSDKDYIPDTDTLLVYGNNLLVVDAKNIKVKPNQTLMLCDGVVIDADKGKEILEVHPSTHIWTEAMKRAGIPLESIDGYVCIVGDTPVDIIRDETWYKSHTKLIHISELKSILEEWVKNKDNTLSLKMLTEIAKAQIKKENDISFDVSRIKREFGI